MLVFWGTHSSIAPIKHYTDTKPDFELFLNNLICPCLWLATCVLLSKFNFNPFPTWNVMHLYSKLDLLRTKCFCPFTYRMIFLQISLDLCVLSTEKKHWSQSLIWWHQRYSFNKYPSVWSFFRSHERIIAPLLLERIK